MKVILIGTLHTKKKTDHFVTRESMLFVKDFNLGEEEREADTVHALQNHVKWYADRLREKAVKRIAEWKNPHGSDTPNGFRVSVVVPKGQRKIRGFNKSKILTQGLDIDL